jgi:K+-transporting ATPase KdpF subunit
LHLARSSSPQLFARCLVSLGLLFYLTYALLRPERF